MCVYVCATPTHVIYTRVIPVNKYYFILFLNITRILQLLIADVFMIYGHFYSHS